MSKHLALIAVVLMAGLLAPAATAQVVVQNEIIVPIQSVMMVNTTVSVPDRGGISLGGFRSASSTRNELGPGLNRGLAHSGRAQEVSAHVWIHDFEELEAGIAARNGKSSSLAPIGFAASIRQYASATTARTTGQSEKQSTPATSTAASSSTPNLGALAAVRKARELEAAGKSVEAAEQWMAIRDQFANEVDSSELARALVTLKSHPGVTAALNEPRAADMLKRGQDAESQGKLKVARIFYQSAARLAPAPSGETAQARLTKLDVRLAGN